jgi:hypothetical protein
VFPSVSSFFKTPVASPCTSICPLPLSSTDIRMLT